MQRLYSADSYVFKMGTYYTIPLQKCNPVVAYLEFCCDD